MDTAVGPAELHYDGKPLAGGLIALDTETTGLDLDELELVILVASDGDRRIVIPPHQVRDFLHDHAEHHWTFHHAAFDVWVLHHHLNENLNQCPVFEQVRRGRVHDTLLLAGLLNIATAGQPDAEHGFAGKSLKLEALARRFTTVAMDKAADEKYRLHYADILDRDLVEVAAEDPGWFDYAIRDVEATLQLGAVLLHRSIGLATENEVPPERIQQFGALTEQVQIRGAIALADVERNGIAVDLDTRERTAAEIEAELLQHVKRIDAVIEDDPAFAHIGSPVKRRDDGTPCRTPKGSVSLDNPRLRDLLARVAEAAGLPMPLTHSGEMSLRADDWARFTGPGKVDDQRTPGERLVGAWLDLAVIGKRLSFLPPAARDHVHPRYRPLLATGRTSCSSPNVQQLPRTGGIRETYRSRPGHVLIAADYSALELRTLAQECHDRFGYSQLKDAFDAGEDPHVLTAASILGMDVNGFKAMKQTDPDGFKQARQAAKAANFGYPGGLGSATFVTYARSTFGVEFTEDEARRLKEAWQRAYPEVVEFLRDDTVSRIATALGTTPEHFLEATGYPADDIPPWFPAVLPRVLAGEPKRDGTDYAASVQDAVWNAVAATAADPAIADAAERRVLPTPLINNLTRFVATSRTGRVRGQCTFCQSRNTLFQGLAADGAKLALFDLVQRGYRVVAFVHDEIAIEVPEDSDFDAAAEQLKRSMVGAMRLVCPDVPIDVSDPAASFVMSKDVEAIRDPEGRLVPWTFTHDLKTRPVEST